VQNPNNIYAPGSREKFENNFQKDFRKNFADKMFQAVEEIGSSLSRG
jgi:hypothetical protein